MKKHNIFKVVLLAIIFVILCSWIFPSAYYQGEFVKQAREQVGLFNLFSYPLITIWYFYHIFFYVLLCGGLYGVLGKIPAYKTLLEKIVKGFRGHESIFLVLVMVLLALITSFVGFSFGLIVVFPMIISIALMMGYNRLVAGSITVGSVICGLIGTTYATDVYSVVDSVLGTTPTSDLLYKIILLVLSLALLIFHVLRYAKKSKNQNVSVKEELIPETVAVPKGKKVHILPLVIVFDCMLIIMLLGAFPWSSVFPDFTFFSDAATWLQGYELFGFPIFDKILGQYQVFGNWGFFLGNIGVAEFPVMICITTIVLALIYRVKVDDFLDGIGEGMKKAAKPALLMLLIFMILVISTYHPVQLLFDKVLLDLGKGLNVVTMSAVAFLSSFFNVQAEYVAQSVLPYVMGVITDSSLYSLIAIIFKSVYGLSMLVLPSSILLMGTLSYLDISYGKWLKHIWKLFVEILVVLLVVFMIILAV